MKLPFGAQLVCLLYPVSSLIGCRRSDILKQPSKPQPKKYISVSISEVDDENQSREYAFPSDTTLVCILDAYLNVLLRCCLHSRICFRALPTSASCHS